MILQDKATVVPGARNRTGRHRLCCYEVRAVVIHWKGADR